MKIKIVDSIMGSGKTSWAIQHMNETNDNFIFITPFLNEVKRIKDECVIKKFKEPINFGKGKHDNLHHLLANNDNIVSTHALFRMSTETTKELISCGEYTLILDEVLDVVEQVFLKKDDLDILLGQELVKIENGFLLWNEDKLDVSSAYDDIKVMCINKSLMIINNVILMWNFPVNVFKSFKEVYVLTYKFYSQVQRYYYDLHGVEYDYLTLSKRERKIIGSPLKSESMGIKGNIIYELVEKDINIKENVEFLRKNINIITNDKINNIGDKDFSLSSTWFKRDGNKELIGLLKRNVTNYFINKMKAKSKDILWTTYKEQKPKVSGKGYGNSFISCNLRATNEYGDRHHLAYCLNLFPNPIISQFFISKGVTIDEDGYALSEMLQWIWRSAIRNDEEIWLYIPSKRMRNLLLKFLS